MIIDWSSLFVRIDCRKCILGLVILLFFKSSFLTTRVECMHIKDEEEKKDVIRCSFYSSKKRILQSGKGDDSWMEK